ncbi:MAG: iron-sulfur cluster assembly accessory protein [Methylococcaceae bacterium]|nr:iron-sulfur cluster assembly accessory protein [Methylococcaceae bacterium]MCI0733763.1 iron-sulfur cluster assembly accessory protein [Methylococcaceae bacterium]
MQNMTQEYPGSLSKTDVHVTEAARDMLAGLIDDADEDFEGIRIYVQGGGCGGMSYSMTFAEEVTEYDSVLDCGQFKILVDPIALGFLQGCEIDYVTEGLNSTFVFRNAFQSVGGSGKCAGCGGGGY